MARCFRNHCLSLNRTIFWQQVAGKHNRNQKEARMRRSVVTEPPRQAAEGTRWRCIMSELNASDVWRAQPERHRDTPAERETAANNCSTTFERVASAITLYRRPRQRRRANVQLAKACECITTSECRVGAATAGQLTRMVTSRVERVASCLADYEIRLFHRRNIRLVLSVPLK